MLTVGTFPFLKRQRVSIIPISACIGFGFSLAMFGVALLRYMSAQALEQYQTATPSRSGQVTPEGHCSESGDVVPPLNRHMRILKLVIELKERGAAGGFNGTVRSAPPAHSSVQHGTARLRDCELAAAAVACPAQLAISAWIMAISVTPT